MAVEVPIALGLQRRVGQEDYHSPGIALVEIEEERTHAARVGTQEAGVGDGGALDDELPHAGVVGVHAPVGEFLDGELDATEIKKEPISH
ncbi:hypothetical protein GP486_008696 [Trichoglossum hirsutum]|uniref:Uncharacterized protein n=1 Tax=Trichoglossum hirsutum TaxID=265104 RepID=A0A9P8HXI2_9PEZI|nr:hypothetical protein GP486_008696 [Trichoglossum hirsutum]